MFSWKNLFRDLLKLPFPWSFTKKNQIVKIIVTSFETIHQILIQAKSWNTLILIIFAPHYLYTKITYLIHSIVIHYHNLRIKYKNDGVSYSSSYLFFELNFFLQYWKVKQNDKIMPSSQVKIFICPHVKSIITWSNPRNVN